MSLSDKINTDIKAAMLAREKDKLEALRAVKAAILLEQTAKGGSDSLAPDAELKLLQKLVKQRKESAEIFATQNRQDLADVETFQAAIIEAYLPKQLSEAEVETELRFIINSVGAKGPSDLGKVMGAASKQLAGRADNKLVSQKVRELLQQG